MTADADPKHRSVYRLLPAMREYRTLHPDSIVDVLRWQMAGSTGPCPTEIRAEWGGHPRWKKGDFPHGDASSPVLSRRVADALGGELERAGRLLPVRITGAEDDDYLLYLVERVADCLDPERSSPPDELGRVRESVFVPDAVPVDVPAFRATGFPTAVCWNGWAVERLTDLIGDQLEARLVWSDAPGLVPHRDPWGF